VEQRSPAVRKTIFVLGSILLAGCHQAAARRHSEGAGGARDGCGQSLDRQDRAVHGAPAAGCRGQSPLRRALYESAHIPGSCEGQCKRAACTGGRRARSLRDKRSITPGHLRLDVQPRQAGQYQMTVSLTSPGLDDTHDLGAVVVYAARGRSHPNPGNPRKSGSRS